MSNDDSFPNGADPDQPEDDLQRMLRDLLGSQSQGLSAAAGVPFDTNAFSALINSLSTPEAPGQINWSLAAEQAQKTAAATQIPLTDEDRAAVDGAFRVASLWLAEVTTMPVPPTGTSMNRTEWANATLPFWERLCAPIANSVSSALAKTLSEQAPEQMGPMIERATGMVQRLGTSLFAMQLGTSIGKIATELVSANEIGVPALSSPAAALLPQNVDSFIKGLEGPSADEIRLSLATRELAHVALFRHAPWLASQIELAIRNYAQGIQIDTQVINDLGSQIDPSNPESVRAALEHGSLIPQPTAQQQEAVATLETLLTLIEGWVDTVCRDADTRLPSEAAIAEMYNRRRADGGPAERAFGTLIGLELRPKRLRLAATTWRAITDELGVSGRDDLWRHPDLLPTSAEIGDPEAFLARQHGGSDEIDDDLERLLQGGFDQEDADASPDQPSDGHSDDQTQRPDQTRHPDGNDPADGNDPGASDAHGDPSGTDSPKGPDSPER